MTTGPFISRPLVSTQWLADHLGSDNLVILDASVIPYVQPSGRSGYLSGHESYLLNGHIPGAIFADLIEVFSDTAGTYPFTRPGAELFELAAGSVGIDNSTTVVVYDSLVGQWASRIWWLFRAFGYDSVAVLDGGLTRWNEEERELDIGHVEPVQTSFTAVARPELWADKALVESISRGETEGSLVCGIPAKEFTGEAGTRSRLGHIPGSSSVPAARLVDSASNTVLPRALLAEAFGALNAGGRIVTYCAAGIAASADALALTLLGHTNVSIFDGSLNEWVSDPNAPVEASADSELANSELANSEHTNSEQLGAHGRSVGNR
jgi:thiosulfate/3-mercaptopyruvate sulfurtransferase